MAIEKFGMNLVFFLIRDELIPFAVYLFIVVHDHTAFLLVICVAALAFVDYHSAGGALDDLREALISQFDALTRLLDQFDLFSPILLGLNWIQILKGALPLLEFPNPLNLPLWGREGHLFQRGLHLLRFFRSIKRLFQLLIRLLYQVSTVRMVKWCAWNGLLLKRLRSVLKRSFQLVLSSHREIDFLFYS